MTTAIFLMSALGGCLVWPSADDEDNCTSEFDPRTAGEPLGSSARIERVTLEAGSTEGISVTLGELTDKAGWTRRYDRMIQQFDGMSDTEINELAGTQGICWGVPHTEPTVSAMGSYIFLLGHTPIQGMRWDAGHNDTINFGDTRGAIRPDTVLRSSPGLNPRLVVAGTPEQ
ncbi:hypothetical protein [Gordonia insulae]|uniref:hypothetical protein n=1 Tax=Gordonia insulae TaxID=2420509 RepID=UPI000F5BE7E5|nr:hypothetical protein [Gordonia insulae]